MGLLLEAVEVTGPLMWRWLLRDEDTGNPLADHPVRLDPEGQDLARFSDLYGYERTYAAPDRWVEDGTRFARLAGEWAGCELLGESVGAAILAEAPVTVQVRVPTELERVLLWPLELAHADGKPLAAQDDVTFVYDFASDAPARRKAEVGETLRMLAVFSQPSQTSVLALRRERYALTRLIRQIAGRERARIHLQVVQYGVTRERLARIVQDGDGWDVLHISGHGTGGVLALERDDGAPDLVRVDDLVRLLRPARRRVKLAVVSACESAADTTAQTLRLLGLTEQAEELETTDADATGAGRASTEVPGLARALVRELDCAVVAMRYPVADEFAIAYGDVFYEHLFGRRQTADLAAAKALAEAAGPEPTAARPPLSLATPGVFGARAVGLSLPVPRGKPVIDPAEQRMAYFPAEPLRFVGRAAAMAKASAALAPRSGRTAVLLHGMAGAGKTAGALELAYRHAENFAAAAFWQAPTRDDEWTSALADFANRLDIQLGDYGFTMASHIGTVAALDAFLPRLRAAMESGGVLLVLDNLETLLTLDGIWRDDRWAKLFAALTDHDGESRVILTSRIPPATLLTGPVSPRTVPLPVHALSLDESIALARELPNLRALLHTDVGLVRSDGATGTAYERAEAHRKLAAADRDRARRVLHFVQGHPKLMELADAAAADRSRLDTQLTAAEESASGKFLEAFFRDGTSTLAPNEFLASLTTWTLTALRALSPEARLMAEFVACLEDVDRFSYVIDDNWTDLWRRLGRPGEPPAPGPLLAALAGAALVEAVPVLADAEAAPAPVTGGESDADPGTGDLAGGASPGSAPAPSGADASVSMTYQVHPGVAAAISGAADPDVRAAVDTELAAYWGAVSDWAREREGGEDSGLVVRAGLAAAPYLLRRGDWNTAAFLLEQSVMRDQSPGTVQAVLPSLRRIAAATGKPEDAGRLARVLARVDAGESERLLRGSAVDAAAAGDYRVAWAAAGDLVNLLRDAGRLVEALAVAGEMAEYSQRAGLGPWTRLADQASGLLVLGLMGEHGQVLAETDELRAAMNALPARPDAGDPVNPWNVRETILGTGRGSAGATGEWARCLELDAEAVASKRQRGAGEHEVTRTRFNDAVPLIRLGRLGEAGRLLAECQRVFEDHADTPALATVLATRADLEDKLGHRRAAAELGRAALRLSYARPEPQGIAVGHHNLAISLGRLGEDRAGQRAHRLAAALIRHLSGMAHELARTVHVLASEVRADGGVDVSLPSTVAQVVTVAELTEGVRLAALLAALKPDPAIVEAALAEILRTAATLPPGDSKPDPAPHVEKWRPVIAAITTACQPGQAAPQELLQFLNEQATSQEWSALVAVLRRIVAGERAEADLLTGLDEIDTAIVRETLSRIHQDR